jgi:glutathione peroxidase
MDNSSGLCAIKAARATALMCAVTLCWLPAWTAAQPPDTAAPMLAPAGTNCPSLLSRQVLRLQDEAPQSLCQYAGKVVVVVNTASFCGFTSQYKSLETLHQRYRDRGLVVLGFPSNDFGAQEPGSHKDIAAFCENTFGVKFPMFTKTGVVGSSGAALSPLYADLQQITGASPKWNFHKYVIARNGRSVLSFASNVEPSSEAFTAAIERLLNSK